MTVEEVIERIRKELKMPSFQVFLNPEKQYTEEEYQEFKRDLLNYYDQYVNIEGYFPGVDSLKENSEEDKF